jgi:hypothetical protein
MQGLEDMRAGVVEGVVEVEEPDPAVDLPVA